MDSVSGVDSSLKRVAVVEDFFDIIYAMHVEISTDPGKAPKHAGQKKTYKAVRKVSPSCFFFGFKDVVVSVSSDSDSPPPR